MTIRQKICRLLSLYFSLESDSHVHVAPGQRYTIRLRPSVEYWLHRSIGYTSVYLSLNKVTETHFYMQRDDIFYRYVLLLSENNRAYVLIGVV